MKLQHILLYAFQHNVSSEKVKVEECTATAQWYSVVVECSGIGAFISTL